MVRNNCAVPLPLSGGRTSNEMALAAAFLFRKSLTFIFIWCLDGHRARPHVPLVWHVCLWRLLRLGDGKQIRLTTSAVRLCLRKQSVCAKLLSANVPNDGCKVGKQRQLMQSYNIFFAYWCYALPLLFFSTECLRFVFAFLCRFVLPSPNRSAHLILLLSPKK